MSASAQPQLFDEPHQAVWSPPKAKSGCRRDPAAGPGTCWHWWEGCPNAEKRGCHLLWLKRRAKTTEGAG